MTDILSVIKSVWLGVKVAFDHLYIWVLYLISLLGIFLGESGVLYVRCLIVALCADFVFGIWKSKKQGKGFSLKKASKFLVKAMVYVASICLVHLMDIILGEETVICMQAVTLVGVFTEIYSVFCNIAIINPQFALIPIVQKFLLTTVAEKLNMTEDDLKENLKEVADPKNPKTTLGKDEVSDYAETVDISVDESVNSTKSSDSVEGEDQ